MTEIKENTLILTHKLLINRLIPETIPVAIPPIDQTIAEDDAGSRETLHAHLMILSKEIVTDAARSAAHVFQTPEDIRRNGTDDTTPGDRNTAIGSIRLAYPVRIGVITTGSLRNTRSQDIISPRGSIGPQWSRYSQPLDTSINGVYFEHRDPAPTWSKVIIHKFTEESNADVTSRCWMNLTRDVVLTESPNSVNLGLSSVHTSNELGSVFIPTTIIGTPRDVSNWLPPGHPIDEDTSNRVSRTGSEHDYIAKTDFETRRENQNFGRQNNYMSRPPLD